jgi:hypothetical protein
MAVKIKNTLNNKLFFYYMNRIINKLMKFIPQSHLVGLDRIIIYDTFSGKDKINAAYYLSRDSNSHASIEISFYSVYHGRPMILLFLPFIGKFLLASTLYHEIGHHHHHSLQHGVKRDKSEDYAEKYKKEILREAFWGWRIFLRPFAPFVRYMDRKTKA